MTTARHNDAALDAFIAKKAQIDTLLDRLKTLSDDHFNTAPDDVHWGHVGTLEHCAAQLQRIADAAFGEGEHAAS